MAITDFGSRIERFPEILSEIEELQRQLIDPAINNRDDEFLSENNMIVSEQLARCKEFLEAIKDNWDISKAEGFALDNLLQLKKVYRIGASRSYTDYQYFYGNPGVVVPAGTVLLSTTTPDVFQTVQSLTLTASNAVSSYFKITSVSEFTSYSIVINGKVYSYTTGATPTKDQIYDAFSAAFQADPPGNDINAVSSKEDDTIAVTSPGQFISVQVTSNITANLIVSRVRTEASQIGSFIAPTGTVSRLRIPITGITLTTNTQPYIVGRLRETDEEFRRRGISSVSSDGTATISAITGSLYNNVPNVSNVFVVENATHLVDSDGRPPHSYEVVVSGGDDQLIANDLWRTKPSGIQTVGNTYIDVRDSNNILRLIRFTRPVPILIAVRVRYTLYDEELFPINGSAMIRDSVVAHVNSLGIGKDIIAGRIEAAVYNYLDGQGLDEVIIDMQTISNPSEIPNPLLWSDERIPVSGTQYASTSTQNIYVSEL